MGSDDERIFVDAVKLIALRDQHLETAVEWVRSMVHDPERRKFLLGFCNQLSAGNAPDLRKLNDKWMENLRNLAWLGLTDTLAAYNRKREEEEWR